jgi:hypothetical protein
VHSPQRNLGRKRTPMLSNENPNPNTATIDAYTATLADIKTRNLANRLIQYEHNDSPRDGYDAPNPAHGIRIRRIDLEKSLSASRIPVTQECSDHNSRVAGVGHPEQYEHLWKGRG